MVLGVPIHEHFRVTIVLGYSNLANSEIYFSTLESEQIYLHCLGC